MQNRLNEIQDRYSFVAQELTKNETVRDNKLFRDLSREAASLQPIVEAWEALKCVQKEIADCESMLENEHDSDMKEMLVAEIDELKNRESEMLDEIKILLLPKDEDDDKNAVIEIRAGIGGEEAALFGANLMRMYIRYAERHGIAVSVISCNETEIGGVKEAVISIAGKGAYSRLKFENGVHRVQRVPETETQGRIHTSAATVAVLPEVEDVDIEINNADLRIDTYRSSGAGGQHINKTESAIRITHVPTGIVVQCQNERSQIKNKDTAMRMLKTRLYDAEKQRRSDELAQSRKSKVGSGDRSERVRTYNFPQGRVTDHRVNVTLYRLESFLDGDIDEIIDALVIKRRMELLGTGQSDI